MSKRRISGAHDARRRSLYTIGIAALVTASAVVVAGAHGRHNAAEATPQTPAPVASPLVEATPLAVTTPAPPDDAKPNEMGRFPILMYHSVGDPPLTGRMARFNHLGLSISAALFRSHLEMLRKGGFYPVNMCDALAPEIDVPRGLTPVVLTFDDARASQFRYRKDGALDPNCAIGVLAAFHKKHPDWPERATFYVLPRSQYNPTPFGQAKTEKKKLEYLVAHGYEIANHTTSHRPMARMDAKTLTWEMSFCAAYFHRVVPNAPPMETMALPYGISPAKSLLPVLLGDAKTPYHNKCILLAAGGESYAPGDKRFNRLALPRAGSEPGYIESCIKRLRADRLAKTDGKQTERTYVSDGDTATLSLPKSAMKFVDEKRLGGVKLVVYADPVKAKPKPHSIVAKATRAAHHG